VTGGNVAHLVSQHPGKFGVVVEVSHNTPRKVHVAPRHGKRVDHRRIDDVELKRQVGTVRNLCHCLTLLIHKRLEIAVFIQPHTGNYRGVRLFADGEFLLLRHQVQFALSGNRVAGAGSNHRQKKNERDLGKCCVDTYHW